MLRACASMSSQWTSKFPPHVMEKEVVLWMGWPWLPLSQASKVSEVVKRPFIRAPFWPGGNHAWDWGFQLSQGHHLLSQGHSQSRVIRGYMGLLIYRTKVKIMWVWLRLSDATSCFQNGCQKPSEHPKAQHLVSCSQLFLCHCSIHLIFPEIHPLRLGQICHQSSLGSMWWGVSKFSRLYGWLLIPCSWMIPVI